MELLKPAAMARSPYTVRRSLGSWLFTSLVGFAAMYAVASLWLPFGWDHGILASVGAAVANGELPYRDAWDLKGPLAYFPYAISVLLFGNVAWGIRLLDIALFAPALYVFGRTIAAHTTAELGLMAALTLYLWLSSSGWFFTAQPEVWVVAASIIAVYPYLTTKFEKSCPMLVISGVLIGAVALFKPIYAAFGAVPLIALAVSPDSSLWNFARRITYVVAGALLPILAMAGYFLALGGVEELIRDHLSYSLTVYAKTNQLRLFLRGIGEFLNQPPVVILTPFACVGVWSLKGDRQKLAPLATWLAIAVVLVLAQGKAYPYHWFTVYAPLIMLAAFGCDAILRSSSASPYPGLAAVAAGALLLAHISVVPAREIVRVGALLAGATDAQAHYRKYTYGQYVAWDRIEAARYLQKHTSSSDRVFVWGVDATINFLSGRPNPTRFTFDLPLSLDSTFRQQYREEILRILNATPPSYIVLGIPWETGDKSQSLANFSEFRALLSQGYRHEISIGSLELYRRQGS